MGMTVAEIKYYEAMKELGCCTTDPEQQKKNFNRKCTKDTFKGSLFGCQENVSNTTLTIVCTTNVSIDCDCSDVSNPNERENIHKIKSSQLDAWFVFCFLKIIVCEDDDIPAFSAMMKMGLNYLHLSN